MRDRDRVCAWARAPPLVFISYRLGVRVQNFRTLYLSICSYSSCVLKGSAQAPRDRGQYHDQEQALPEDTIKSLSFESPRRDVLL